jgi:hypothetical protein
MNIQIIVFWVVKKEAAWSSEITTQKATICVASQSLSLNNHLKYHIAIKCFSLNVNLYTQSDHHELKDFTVQNSLLSTRVTALSTKNTTNMKKSKNINDPVNMVVVREGACWKPSF